MVKLYVFLATLICIVILFHDGKVGALSNEDGSEEWGYVQVRPKANMFWWHYKSPYKVENSSEPWPIILWLQGGPGDSGIGLGNFEEIGPLDVNLKQRNFTWLRKADLLFVDTPVGTGFSFVEDSTLLVKTDEDAATDLTTLLIKIFNNDSTLQKCNLFIFGESYGGKFAATLGLSAYKAIKNGTLKATLGGVVLADSWISPEDYVFSWAPLLKDISRIDDNGLQKSNILTEKIKQQLEVGDFLNAFDTWHQLEDVISNSSNYVNFYDFTEDDGSHLNTLSTTKKRLFKRSYSNYITSTIGNDDMEILNNLVNGAIKEKLKIIPQNLKLTFGLGDFMKPRISEVDELLALGVNVTIYNGQVDLICSTKGTEAWVKKLKWSGLQNFLSKDRTPLYCGSERKTKGFFKSYENLSFYWILDAGHNVPIYQPCIALNMVGAITQSPAA
ncbi:serine carboxypeptidase-like 51 [Trifolium pratense]|uniref:serine carboxypeptidase-like 51 n=1 Tax=Trifolium pratense TaxID=57577 RepID=UPI001E69390C|nr:serine carboxypeptidase-like 51 [Trifolium pratense]